MSTITTDTVAIRRLGTADADAVRRLAALDGSRVPGGDLLGAEVDGELRVALWSHLWWRAAQLRPGQ